MSFAPVGKASSIWAMGGSFATYSLAWLAILRLQKSAGRLIETREAVSLFHTSLVTALTAACIWQDRDAFSTSQSGTKWSGSQTVETDVPIITAESEFANQIAGFETGYLLADSLNLFYTFHNRSRSATSRLKRVNYLHLSIHHVAMGSALLLLQHRLATTRVKGMLVIIAMHLMNASSVPGTIRWFLINRAPERKTLIAVMTVLYLSCFAIFRVYLLYYLIYIFGQQMDTSTWNAMGKLRLPCKIGTMTISSVNMLWLLNGIRNFIKRTASHSKIE